MTFSFILVNNGLPMNGSDALALLQDTDALSKLRERGYQGVEFTILPPPEVATISVRGGEYSSLPPSPLHEPPVPCRNPPCRSPPDSWSGGGSHGVGWSDSGDGDHSGVLCQILQEQNKVSIRINNIIVFLFRQYKLIDLDYGFTYPKFWDLERKKNDCFSDFLSKQEVMSLYIVYCDLLSSILVFFSYLPIFK